MEPSPGVRIPPEQLEPETLRAVIEEFVTRDGTDLSDVETRVRAVTDLLHRGDIELWFDKASRSCNIVTSQDRPSRQ